MDYQKIIEAAKAGGEIVAKYFGQALEVEEKSIASDFRTKADLESEKAILEILEANYPKFSIHSEEIGKINKNSEYEFIIDPLDGTNNFIVGLPYFAISIGLYRGNNAIFSVVYHPSLGSTYTAEKNKGAFLDGKIIHVSQTDSIAGANICIAPGYEFEKDQFMKLQSYVRERLDMKRWMENWSPSLDLCLIASGRADIMINNRNDIHDYAAGKLIAIEAGAKVTDFAGNPEIDDRNNQFVISNGTAIHEEMLKVIKETNYN